MIIENTYVNNITCTMEHIMLERQIKKLNIKKLLSFKHFYTILKLGGFLIQTENKSFCLFYIKVKILLCNIEFSLRLAIEDTKDF